MATSDILGDDFFAYLKQAQQATQKAGGRGPRGDDVVDKE